MRCGGLTEWPLLSNVLEQDFETLSALEVQLFTPAPPPHHLHPQLCGYIEY